MGSRFDFSPDGREVWARVGNAGVGLVRIALLFGSAAVAFALILAPILERQAAGDGIDHITTASVRGAGNRIYTVRRSVLQPRPETICIIRENGARYGPC